MKLEIPKNRKQKASPSSNIGKKTPKKVKVKGLVLWNPLTYEYEENEKVVLSAEGRKQLTKLKKPYYRVINIRQAPLGDMVVNLFELNLEDDPDNIRGAYLANHFEPLNPIKDEKTP